MCDWTEQNRNQRKVLFFIRMQWEKVEIEWNELQVNRRVFFPPNQQEIIGDQTNRRTHKLNNNNKKNIPNSRYSGLQSIRKVLQSSHCSHTKRTLLQHNILTNKSNWSPKLNKSEQGKDLHFVVVVVYVLF